MGRVSTTRGNLPHTHKGTPHTTTHSPANAFISYVLKQWQTHKTQEKRSRLSSLHLSKGLTGWRILMQTTRKQLQGVSSFPTLSTLNIERESLFSVSILRTIKTAYSEQHERRNSSNSSKAIATRCEMSQALYTLRRAKLWSVARATFQPPPVWAFISYVLRKWQNKRN